jgi:chromosome condensin MukBEF complex kleisin-like MukF subunit
MSKYNGHTNWSQWNVSLWLNNDEALYNGMRNAIRWTKNRTEAASKMLAWLKDSGQTETPDGAAYTVTSIKHAMVGM